VRGTAYEVDMLVRADRVQSRCLGVRSRCRFRKRGTEHVSKSGMERMSWSTK
jgi:hypothetical protein